MDIVVLWSDVAQRRTAPLGSTPSSSPHADWPLRRYSGAGRTAHAHAVNKVKGEKSVVQATAMFPSKFEINLIKTQNQGLAGRHGQNLGKLFFILLLF